MAINNDNSNTSLEDRLSTLIMNNQGNRGLDLSAIIEAIAAMGEPKKKATERDTNINIPELMEGFRNKEYRPGGTGNVHFMGGSPFPQSPGQQRAEKVGATLGATSNILNSGKGIVESGVLGAIWDAIQKRRGQGNA